VIGFVLKKFLERLVVWLLYRKAYNRYSFGVGRTAGKY